MRAASRPAQVALAWLLARPGVTTVIVGARTDEQLADNLAAADLSSTRRGARAARAGQPAAAARTRSGTSATPRRDRLSAADLSLIESYLPGGD